MWSALSALLERTISWLCHGILYVTTGAIFVILCANVILRYSTGSSLQWASEVPELLFPWLVMAGIVLATQNGTHISVVILVQRLPLTARRWVLAIGGVVTVALYALLAAAAWTLMPIANDELSPMLQVPGSVTVGSLLLGFILIALLTLLEVQKVWSGTSAAVPTTATT
jgi:TRAP-type transport system small permease protein